MTNLEGSAERSAQKENIESATFILLTSQIGLKPLIFLLLFLILRQFLKLFQLICQVLEIGGPIVILATEMFLLHGPILREFLGAVVLASRHFKALSQSEDLTLLLTFQSFDRLDRRIFILLHVIVPGGREFLELLTLY